VSNTLAYFEFKLIQTSDSKGIGLDHFDKTVFAVAHLLPEKHFAEGHLTDTIFGRQSCDPIS
jgi:hypothetical protein